MNGVLVSANFFCFLHFFKNALNFNTFGVALGAKGTMQTKSSHNLISVVAFISAAVCCDGSVVPLDVVLGTICIEELAHIEVPFIGRCVHRETRIIPVRAFCCRRPSGCEIRGTGTSSHYLRVQNVSLKLLPLRYNMVPDVHEVDIVQCRVVRVEPDHRLAVLAAS